MKLNKEGQEKACRFSLTSSTDNWHTDAVLSENTSSTNKIRSKQRQHRIIWPLTFDTVEIMDVRTDREDILNTLSQTKFLSHRDPAFFHGWALQCCGMCIVLSTLWWPGACWPRPRAPRPRPPPRCPGRASGSRARTASVTTSPGSQPPSSPTSRTRCGTRQAPASDNNLNVDSLSISMSAGAAAGGAAGGVHQHGDLLGGGHLHRRGHRAGRQEQRQHRRLGPHHGRAAQVDIYTNTEISR